MNKRRMHTVALIVFLSLGIGVTLLGVGSIVATLVWLVISARNWLGLLGLLVMILLFAALAVVVLTESAVE